MNAGTIERAHHMFRYTTMLSPAVGIVLNNTPHLNGL